MENAIAIMCNVFDKEVVKNGSKFNEKRFEANFLLSQLYRKLGSKYPKSSYNRSGAENDAEMHYVYARYDLSLLFRQHSQEIIDAEINPLSKYELNSPVNEYRFYKNKLEGLAKKLGHNPDRIHEEIIEGYLKEFGISGYTRKILN